MDLKPGSYIAGERILSHYPPQKQLLEAEAFDIRPKLKKHSLKKSIDVLASPLKMSVVSLKREAGQSGTNSRALQ